MLKSNKGITLISLTIYIILLIIIIATASMAMNFFYKDVNETVLSKKTADQYSRFVAYLAEDVNSGKVEKVKSNEKNDTLTLVYNDGTNHQYVYEDGKIYYFIIDSDNNVQKQIQLCVDVQNCQFECEYNQISTFMSIGETVYSNNFSI